MSTVATPRRSRGGGRMTAALVVLGWLLVLGVLAPFAGRLSGAQRNDAVDYLPASAQSTRVAQLQSQFPGGQSIVVLLVYHRDNALTTADRDAIAAQVDALSGRYGLTRAATPATDGPGGNAVLYPLSIPRSYGTEAEVVPAVRDAVQGVPAGLTVQVTGPGAVKADLSKVFKGLDKTLLLVTVLVVAVLLVLTYRSPLLWAAPLLTVAAGALVATAVVYGLVRAFGLVVSTQSSSIMTVLIFGAGTDYALLLVSRYREELRRIERPADAMWAALRGSGPAVLASAGTVVAALLCLLAADNNSSKGLGPVGAVGILAALATTMTLLPALLVLAGRRVFWPFVPRIVPVATGSRGGTFALVGAAVGRRSGLAIAGSVLALAALSAGMLLLPGGLRQVDSFTRTPESVAGFATIARDFPGANGEPVTVLTRPEHRDEVLAAVRGTEGVANARPGRTGDGWAEIAAYPDSPPESAAETATILRLRTRLAGIAGAEALVGGTSAEQIDDTSTGARDTRLVIPLVLAVVLVILAVLLRSLVAPVLLVTAVVGSWAAALGLSGLVFKPVFGFAGLDSAFPLLSFVFLVALGVDYGIFLMHRMRQEAASSDPREAPRIALASTGVVLASAGVVLAATFVVLTVLPLVMMVELGFAVAVGVLLATLLVQPVLVTAAATRLGARMWWPSRLARAHAEEPEPEPEPVTSG